MDSNEMEWVDSYKGYTLRSIVDDPYGYRKIAVVHGKVKLRSRCRGWYWRSCAEQYHAIYGGKSRSYKTLEEALAMVNVQAKMGITI